MFLAVFVYFCIIVLTNQWPLCKSLRIIYIDACLIRKNDYTCIFFTIKPSNIRSRQGTLLQFSMDMFFSIVSNLKSNSPNPIQFRRHLINSLSLVFSNQYRGIFYARLTFKYLYANQRALNILYLLMSVSIKDIYLEFINIQ